MKITGFDIYAYALPLARPLPRASAELRVRQGYLLVLQSDGHDVGIGEVAPVPGFSRETRQDVEAQLLGLRGKVLHRQVPDELEQLTWHFEAWLKSWKLSPSVRCGFEMAVLDLLAREQGVTLAGLLNAQAPDRVVFSGLLTGAIRRDIQLEAGPSLKQMVRSFKLKVGSSDIKADIDRVLLALDIIGQGRLHLDANRAWRRAQAVNFTREIPRDRIDYLEEPLEAGEDLAEFSRAGGFPLAFDETLRDAEPGVLPEVLTLKTLVLKPMILGGFERAMAWSRFAREQGLKVAVSSGFESAVGLGALAHFACAAGDAAGLDTGRWFDKDLTTETFTLKLGCLIPPAEPLEKDDIDFNLLTPVKDA
jgi:o-succinylbenzoate synthase